MMDFYLFSDITDTEARRLAEFAEGVPDGEEVRICITSYGGEVFAAVAMIGVIREMRARGCTVTADVMGLCASAATMIALACERVLMRPGSMLMFHSASGPDGRVVERINAIQRELISRRVRDAGKIDGLVSKSNTFLTPEEAYALGLCDSISPEYPASTVKSALIAAAARGAFTLAGGGIEMDDTVQIDVREGERRDAREEERRDDGDTLMDLMEALTRSIEELTERVRRLEASRGREELEERIDEVIEARAARVYARLGKIMKPAARAAGQTRTGTPEQDLARAKSLYGSMALPD